MGIAISRPYAVCSEAVACQGRILQHGRAAFAFPVLAVRGRHLRRDRRICDMAALLSGLQRMAVPGAQRKTSAHRRTGQDHGEIGCVVNERGSVPELYSWDTTH